MITLKLVGGDGVLNPKFQQDEYYQGESNATTSAPYELKKGDVN